MKLEFHDLVAVTDNTTNIMIGGELLTVNSSHKKLEILYTRDAISVKICDTLRNVETRIATYKLDNDEYLKFPERVACYRQFFDLSKHHMIVVDAEIEDILNYYKV